MQKARAIARTFAADPVDVLRGAIVAISGIALIAAGQYLPFS